MQTNTLRPELGVRVYGSTPPVRSATTTDSDATAEIACRVTAAVPCARDEEDRADRRFEGWLRRNGRAGA
ncbi:MAG TPA: hypothetical protein VIB48_05065 [Acidimicrobiia bacterium]|jgi:hypothetical protein